MVITGAVALSKPVSLVVSSQADAGHVGGDQGDLEDADFEEDGDERDEDGGATSTSTSTLTPSDLKDPSRRAPRTNPSNAKTGACTTTPCRRDAHRRRGDVGAAGALTRHGEARFGGAQAPCRGDHNHARSKVEFVRKSLVAMIKNAFYVLPNTTLTKCMGVLPVANEADDAISLPSHSQSLSPQVHAQDPRFDAPALQDKVVEGVKIGPGRNTLFYARATIETMKRVQNLKEAADEGLAFVRWLERDVAAAVPSNLKQEVQDLGTEVSKR
jgi:hypothetical protein